MQTSRWMLVVAVAAFLVVTVACGDAAVVTSVVPPATTPPPSPGFLEYAVSGGFAGISEVWTIHEDGRVVDIEGVVSSVDPAVTAALLVDIEALGFFDMDTEYLPDDPCCDRFQYELAATIGGQEHRVVTMDEVEGVPAEFHQIVGRIGEIIASAR